MRRFLLVGVGVFAVIVVLLALGSSFGENNSGEVSGVPVNQIFSVLLAESGRQDLFEIKIPEPFRETSSPLSSCKGEPTLCKNIHQEWLEIHSLRTGKSKDFIQKHTAITSISGLTANKDIIIRYNVLYPNTDIVATTYDRFTPASLLDFYSRNSLNSYTAEELFHITDFDLDTPLRFSSLLEANLFIAKKVKSSDGFHPKFYPKTPILNSLHVEDSGDPYIILSELSEQRVTEDCQQYFGYLNMRTGKVVFKKEGPCQVYKF